MQHNKLIFFIFIALIIGFCISASPFIFQFNIFRSHKNLTTTSLVITTTTAPKIINVGVRGMIKLNNGIDISYEIVRRGMVEESDINKVVYDIELKSVNYTTFTKDDINLISHKILSQIFEPSDVKKIDFLFFSDRGMIKSKPFDIAFASCDLITNKINITLRSEIKIQ